MKITLKATTEIQQVKGAEAEKVGSSQTPLVLQRLKHEKADEAVAKFVFAINASTRINMETQTFNELVHAIHVAPLIGSLQIGCV